MEYNEIRKPLEELTIKHGKDGSVAAFHATLCTLIHGFCEITGCDAVDISGQVFAEFLTDRASNKEE